MQIHWAVTIDAIGNAFGYSTHSKNLKKALEEKNVIMSEDSETAVHICTPNTFHPIEGKYNILYTMYECTTIPKNWIEPVNQCDLLVVPCHHNKKLFANYTDKPIEVCWEGVNVDYYKYVERSFPVNGKPFIFLFVGASNPRKGYEHVIQAWDVFNDKHRELNHKVMLVMKTTQVTRPMRVAKIANSIIDTRKLPFEKESAWICPECNIYYPMHVICRECVCDTEEIDLLTMIEMYSTAHAFMLPSMGEGFGLTLAEAMATGLPCIYTPWSGPVDFISKAEGFPVKFKIQGINTQQQDAYGNKRIVHTTKAASADIDSIVREMEKIYYYYDEALERGKKAAARIRRDITWSKSADSFIEIVRKYRG